MLSSTSNSNERLPTLPWLKTWGLCLLLFGLVTGGYELFWRARGFRPSANDDINLWARVLHRIPDRDPAATVALGASRIRLGFDTRMFEREFNGRAPHQLAIAGSLCFPVFKHLVDETDFTGVVLYDAHPGAFCGTPHLANLDEQARYLERTKELSAINDLDVWLGSVIDLGLVCRRSDLTLKSLAVFCLEQRRLPKFNKWVQFDRQQLADFSDSGFSTPIEADSKEDPREFEPEVFESRVSEMKLLVDRFRARGGEIFLVRMPSSGSKLAREELEFPRAREWDELVRRLSAPAFHFQDDPRTAALKVPDGGHLDFRDASLFTQVLVEKMREAPELAKRAGPISP